MGIVFRQSVKTTIVTFSGAILGALVLLLSTKLIAQQQFGFARSLLSQAVVGSQLILTGMHTMLYVFIHKYPPEHKGRSVLITISMIIPIGLTALLGLIYMLAKPAIVPLYTAEDILLVDRYFFWLPIFVLLWGLLTILEQFLNAHMKVAASNFLREVVLRLLNIVVILAFGFELVNFDQFIMLSVLVHTIPVALLWLMARRIEGFQLSTDWQALSKTEYKHIFDFAFFHLLLNLSVTLLDNIDILMIPILSSAGMSSVGIYTIAVYVTSIYQIPYRTLGAAATPILNKEYHNNNMEKVRELFSRSSVNIWIASFGMAILIIANLDNGLALLPKTYASAYSVILILMIGKTINMLTGLNNEVISISNYYRFNFYITALLIALIITFNLFLIPKYGINGAAWGTSIALGIYNLIKLLFLWVKFRLSPFTPTSIYIILAAATAYGLGLLLPYIYHPVSDAIVRSMVILIIYIVILYKLKASPDFNQYVYTILKKKKLF